MTKNAQQALKTLLQTSQHNVRFCLICNYISKIDESLQREFICVRFNQLPPAEIRQFIRRIADAESLSMDTDDIDILMANHQSDIRSMINFMQSTYFGDASGKAFGQDHKTKALRPVSSQEWSELTQFLKMNDTTGAREYISKISLLHNLNKKQILIGYMNHILRKYTHFICPELVDTFENVAHSSDDMPCDDLVAYFVTNVQINTTRII
jgi:DNA polymerase III delta prime subunit